MTRKLTDARIAALKLADEFESLPSGARPMQLADALEYARVDLNLGAMEYLYMRMAIRNTSVKFWFDGREPIFGWSRITIAVKLGICERSVSRLEEALVRKGLIVHRDGPMLRRHGGSHQRDGRGVSLAPIGARYDEIMDRARRVLREQREWGEARTEIYAAKEHLKAAAERDDVPDDVQEEIQEVLDEIPPRVSASTLFEELDRIRKRAAKLVVDILPHVSETETAHMRATSVTHKTNPDSLIQRARIDDFHTARLIAKADEMGLPPSVALKAANDRGVERVNFALRGLRKRLNRSESPVRSPGAYFQWLVSNDYLYFRDQNAYARHAL